MNGLNRMCLDCTERRLTAHMGRKEQDMEYGVLIREYKGMYFVEFVSKSLGCTLLATWDKTQAQAEYERFKGMTEKQMREYLLAR